MAQYEYDKQIKQITSFILKLKEDIKDMNSFVLQKIDNEIIKLKFDRQELKEELTKKVDNIKELIDTKENNIAIDNQRIQDTITELFRPMETKIKIVSDNMSSVFSYIKEIESKTLNDVVLCANGVKEETKKTVEELEEEFDVLIEEVEEIGEKLDKEIEKNDLKYRGLIKAIKGAISEKDKKQHESVQKNLLEQNKNIQKNREIIDNLKEKVGRIQESIKKYDIENIKKILNDIEDMIIIDDKKKSKNTTYSSDKIEELLKNISSKKTVINTLGGSSKVQFTGMNRIIALGVMNFYVDIIVGNQITEAHREDTTTIVNTYNGDNKLTTALYTFPDSSTITLTITYDVDGNISTALYS